MTTAVTSGVIVVGVDGSPTSNGAIQWAARDAALRNVALSIVHVINPVAATRPLTPLPLSFGQWQEQRGHHILDAAVKIVEESTAHGAVHVNIELLFGGTIPALVDLSQRAQMMVLGWRGRGAAARRLLGSVSSAMIRYAGCPVAVIPDEDPLLPHRAGAPVLVGVDGSPASELATAIAFDEASRRGVELVALHAWSDVAVSGLPDFGWSELIPEAQEVLAERLAGWQERYPDVEVERLIVADDPAYQLIERSGSAQLTVIGSHGRGGFAAMLLGSVSYAVVQSARMPVIVARQPLPRLRPGP
jgi:nucleotide-binding universal stress UspA family protein